ncbi:helix-turn-helix domain-containing protein [Paenibacillus sp. NPDC058174]|uniref:helix-turn-helix transcriptional regulator n=1 Tax=Paenibacillus sp. NPDC058174 TaxID=3346366 RepID=UPI0036D8E5B5
MNRHGLQIQWAARYEYKRGDRLEPHQHRFFQLIYFVDGNGRFTLDEQAVPISPGVFFLIAPGVMHGFSPQGGRASRTLDLKFNLYDEELLDAALGCAGAFTDDDGQIKPLLEKIRSEGDGKQSYYQAISALMLSQLIYQLARKRSLAEPNASAAAEQEAALTYEPQEAAQRLAAYIEAHFAQDITLNDAAYEIGYSNSYLGRVFRASYGMTFSQYLRQVRVEQAQKLIIRTSGSLKTIAWQVGFKTIYHFTRVFKEVEGMSPGEWRQREQAGIRKDIYFD